MACLNRCWESVFRIKFEEFLNSQALNDRFDAECTECLNSQELNDRFDTECLECIASQGFNDEVVSIISGYSFPTTPLAPYIRTLFVGKHGNDANPGTNPNAPKLTFTSAIAAASALVPSSTARVLIYGLDAGIYIEAIVVPSYVFIDAPWAVLTNATTTTLEVEDFAEVVFDTINNTHANGNINTASCIAKRLPATSISKVYVRDVNVGVGGAGVRNFGFATQLFIRAEKIVLPNDSYGVVAADGTGAGHIHCYIGDIYINGNNSVGFWASGQGTSEGTVVGHVEHILTTGGTTNRTAVLLTGNANNPRINMSCDELAGVEIALSVQRGEANLSVPRVQGNISIGANGVAYVDFLNHVSGSITNLGTLKGRIGTNLYGMTIIP